MTPTRSLWYYTSLMRIAKKLGLGVMLYANGVRPVVGELEAKLAREALQDCDIISPREALSLEELGRLGVQNKNVYVTADPAFMFAPCEDEWKKHLLAREGLEPGQRACSLWPCAAAKGLPRTLRARLKRLASRCVIGRVLCRCLLQCKEAERCRITAALLQKIRRVVYIRSSPHPS